MKGDGVSGFWMIVLPALLLGTICYVYSEGGFFSRWVQAIVDPFLHLAQVIVNLIFGTNF